MKQLQDQNKKYKRQIKAMKRSPTDPTPEDSKSENESVNDAGDEFGGRNNKTKRRKSK